MKLPTPRKRGDAYRIEIMIDGKRMSATRDTIKECHAWASRKLLESKAGQLSTADTRSQLKLGELMTIQYEASRRQSKGKRTDLNATLVDDLSKHVFANLPVTMVFAVTDAAGNEGTSAPYAVTLHGKRFFDPLAAALIEMRRDILWNRINAPRAVELLKAVTNRPEGFEKFGTV